MNAGKTLILILAFLIPFSHTMAQSFISPKSLETGGEFSFSFERNSNKKEISFASYSFKAFAGLMTLPGLEIGFSPSIAGYNYSGVSETMFNLYLLPSYNFNLKSSVFPYIELIAGIGITDNGYSVANVIGLGSDIGIKAMLNKSALFIVKIEYIHNEVNFQRESDSRNYVPKDYNFDSLTFGVGFRYLIIHNAD
jgi:hypothetical protein